MFHIFHEYRGMKDTSLQQTAVVNNYQTAKFVEGLMLLAPLERQTLTRQIMQQFLQKCLQDPLSSVAFVFPLLKRYKAALLPFLKDLFQNDQPQLHQVLSIIHEQLNQYMWASGELTRFLLQSLTSTNRSTRILANHMLIVLYKEGQIQVRQLINQHIAAKKSSSCQFDRLIALETSFMVIRNQQVKQYINIINGKSVRLRRAMLRILQDNLQNQFKVTDNWLFLKSFLKLEDQTCVVNTLDLIFRHRSKLINCNVQQVLLQKLKSQNWRIRVKCIQWLPFLFENNYSSANDIFFTQFKKAQQDPERQIVIAAVISLSKAASLLPQSQLKSIYFPALDNEIRRASFAMYINVAKQLPVKCLPLVLQTIQKLLLKELSQCKQLIFALIQCPGIACQPQVAQISIRQSNSKGKINWRQQITIIRFLNNVLLLNNKAVISKSLVDSVFAISFSKVAAIRNEAYDLFSTFLKVRGADQVEQNIVELYREVNSTNYHNRKSFISLASLSYNHVSQRTRVELLKHLENLSKDKVESVRIHLSQNLPKMKLTFKQKQLIQVLQKDESIEVRATISRYK